MTAVDVRVPGPATPLSGTLELPGGPGPFPGVVLLSGSGPLDRDSRYKKANFDVSRALAGALAEVGAASLRYDKRGVGQSAGDWRAVGLLDNADDAEAAVRMLREHPRVREDAVFVVGHSEGAIIATLLAGRGVPLAGIGLLSGTARSGAEMLLWQTAAIVPTLPRPVRALLRLLRVDPVAKVAANQEKVRVTTKDVARIGGVRTNARWMREFLDYDPGADLRSVDVPVIAVTGSKDLQVPPADLAAIAEATAGRAETHLVPDLTHSLRRQPGAPSLSRYRRELKEPVDAEVLRLVSGWVLRVAAGVRPSPATAP